MLGIMRKYKQSVLIKIVFCIIVLSFVGTIFLVWGRGDEATGGDFAAKVNGTKISMDDYLKNYDRMKSLYQQIYGQAMTPDLEKQLGIRKMAINSLIDNALAVKEAKRMGIAVNKDEIANEIAKVPAFQKDGVFNFDQYTQMLKAYRMTPANFEEGQEQEMLVKKAREKVKERATVSDQDLQQAFNKQNDKVDLSFISFSPGDVRNEVKVTDQDLTTYLQGHEKEFQTPEKVSIAYALVSPSQYSSKATVTDEEAETYYRKNIDRYQGKGGILPFAEVKDRAKADAIKQKGAKEAYETVADTINKNLKGGDIKAAAASLGVKVEETPLFTAKTAPAPLADEGEVIKRAFLLKQGELGGPIETAKGIYIIKVMEKKPAAVPPLAEIKGQLTQKVTEEKARELAKKKAEEALAQLAKGTGTVKTQETGAFAYAANGVIPRIGTSPDLMEAAFNLTAAAPTPKNIFKAGDRWYAVKLKQRIELNRADFQKNKEQIRQTLLPKKQQEALDNWMKELKAKAKIQINPSILSD
ncbi:peptidylprolyl isomerase [Geotalea toluenoxydans]|uniref:peptidylprolyl isomerase n=1 Tax=Geotalea toluenoxydans TaxID=421624 RepID=UPI0006D0075D|nr:peptidylprolyl isomerase [Geotalea toluenoxydans]